ncbi:MAG TPA: hemerythrin domain-containing protein [Streptosporangiaceae bacterium]|nr:hemerythrin domain-containing protein [Streptosporangiaceae bacterium]
MPAPDRAVALSEQLIHVHRALRERLASLRQEAAGGAGHRAADATTGEDLFSHCLSFCSAIHTHHTGEDSHILPALRAAAPELATVIDNLIEDHALVAGILRRIRELVTVGWAASGPDALVRELDGLIAILESHFSYEERRIAKALDALGPGAWTAEVFAPGRAAASCRGA